jgi:prolyl-tRNA synthetase
MKLSNYFLPLLKESPQEASIVSHQLMLRAGMIRQLCSGIYSWLPLGLKVLKKVEGIVRRNLNEAGCNEILMPCVQPADLWLESGRYDAYGKEMLRIKDRHDHDMLFGPTAEEIVTDIFRKNVKSYKDLPLNLYQIQWKFRDEIRPRFGVMRGREFYMNDAYSFDLDFKSAKKTYYLMYETYLKIFKELGLFAIPLKADTGPIGGDLSHEFQVIADTGESELYYDKEFDQLAMEKEIDFAKMKTLYAAADEMHDPKKIPEDRLCVRRGIEVGHIFCFGTKYSERMGATVMDCNGKAVPVEMGSYGIGISRLLGAIIESSHDEKGIIWPEAVAPFQVMITNLRPGNEECDAVCNKFYIMLQDKGIEVLLDDSVGSIGSKLNTAELIGIPKQVIVGPRDVKEKLVELKDRKTGEKEKISVDLLINRFTE